MKNIEFTKNIINFNKNFLIDLIENGKKEYRNKQYSIHFKYQYFHSYFDEDRNDWISQVSCIFTDSEKYYLFTYMATHSYKYEEKFSHFIGKQSAKTMVCVELKG